MKAVILAAGKGIRASPLTLTKPKPLLKAGGSSIIEHNLNQLIGLVSEVIIVVGYMKEKIIETIGDNFKGLKINYVEQNKQLGTGHALGLVKDIVSERFVVLNGDDFYSRFDIERCLRHKYAVLAKKVKNWEKFGVFELEGNVVKKIVEKPKKLVSDLANTGVYVLDKSIFKIRLEKSKRGEFEIVDYVNSLLTNEVVICEIVSDFWFPIAYAWSLLEANEFFVEKISNERLGEIERGVTVHGKLKLGKGSKLMSGVYIEGNVIIGENCKIGPNCYLRAGTVIGNDCRIGNAVEIKNSIIGNDVNVAHLSYIGDSVIGDDVNIGGGMIVGNLRHDNSSVKSMISGELVDTGRRKFGTVIGDGVKTGLKTSIYPGRKLWPKVFTKPGEIVDKDITDV